MHRRRSASFIVLALGPLAVCAPWATARAQALDPDAYDPVLDRPAPPTAARRHQEAKPGGPGFFVGGGGFLYAGNVKSKLLKREGGLESGLFSGVALTIGGRARIPLEIGFDVGYGLGSRFNPKSDEWDWAHDMLLEPRVLWHVAENERWDFAPGAAATFWLFDVGLDGVSQTLMGPGLVLALRRHLDARSLLFLELAATYGKDTLAHETIDPTEEELLEDPTAESYRERGAWYPIFRLSAGYRLSGF